MLAGAPWRFGLLAPVEDSNLRRGFSDFDSTLAALISIKLRPCRCAVAVFPMLKTENPTAGSEIKGHAPIWTTADTRRVTAIDALGMAMVRALPASRAARLRCRRHPMGARRIKR